MSERMPEFKIDFDISAIAELQEKFADVGKKPTFNAFRRSLQRTLDGAVLEATRMYADQYKGQIAKLKAAKIIRGVVSAGDGENVRSVSAGIVFRSLQPSLTALSGKQDKGGVKWGRGQYVRSGFKAVTGFQTNKDGDIGSESYSFFRRTGKFTNPKRGVWAGVRYVRGPKRGQLVLREQIKKLVGYSPSFVFAQKESAKRELEFYIRDRFNTEMGYNLSFYVNRALAQGSKGAKS